MLKPGGYAIWVVGNNSTNVSNKRIEIPTDDFIWQIGALAGWNQISKLSMELLASRDIFKKNKGSAETILVFQKPINRTAIYSSIDENNHSNEWDFDNEKTQEFLRCQELLH